MGYYELAKNSPRILIFETILVSMVLMVAFFLAQLFGRFFSDQLRNTSELLGHFLLLILSILVLIVFVWLIYDCGPQVPKADRGQDPLITESFAEALDPSLGAP